MPGWKPVASNPYRREGNKDESKQFDSFIYRAHKGGELGNHIALPIVLREVVDIHHDHLTEMPVRRIGEESPMRVEEYQCNRHIISCEALQISPD